MINHISISNFAIIENTEIDFENGLNIITGETGAGKSIVVEAISLALGSRADSSYVRTGTDKAIVQLAGDLNNEEIIITREVSSNGKNLCKLNGELITLGQLNETCKKLADIHGQYDNQSLLNGENHINLVDNYHLDLIKPARDFFNEIFAQYNDAKSRLNKLLTLEQENIKKRDFYEYEVKEIDNAKLLLDEDKSLEETISLLQNSEKIFSALESTYSALSDEDYSILSSLSNSLHSIEDIESYSSNLTSVSAEFKDIYYRLEDLSSTIRELRDGVSFSPDDLDNAISRLDLIDNLKKKYGHDIPAILEYRDRIALYFEQINNFDQLKDSLEKEVAEIFAHLTSQSRILTELRKESAAELETKIEAELHGLNFHDSKLKIQFSNPPAFLQNGNDLVEILISTNKGEPLKPLIKIASGGEISRIMLAFKNITCSYDNIPTMIFDEIDSGVSGVTASIVGKKLQEISIDHQVICITHLAQIAAYGNYNYRIHKESDEQKTYTIVEKLSESEKINEIARLLGGTKISETTRDNAKELINNTFL